MDDGVQTSDGKLLANKQRNHSVMTSETSKSILSKCVASLNAPPARTKGDIILCCTNSNDEPKASQFFTKTEDSTTPKEQDID